MTAVLGVVLVAVALVAAVRSTWSPCGLSMLSTITPMAERAKGHRYGATCAWFVAGAVVGGLALGALGALGAVVVHALDPSTVAAASVALVAVAVALVSDRGLARVRVPVHFRQVNERWLDAYRPWVYGAGFGFQIGTGLATYITTAAVYLLVVLGALTGLPVVALAVGALFGLVRGLAVLLTRRVGSAESLLGFHRRFAGLLPAAERAVTVVLASAAAVLVVVAWPVSVAVVAALAVVTLVLRVALRGRCGVAPACPVGDAPGDRTADAPSVPVG